MATVTIGMRRVHAALALCICLPLAGCQPPLIDLTISGGLQAPVLAVQGHGGGGALLMNDPCVDGITVYAGEQTYGQEVPTAIVWRMAWDPDASSCHLGLHQFKYGVVPEGAKPVVDPQALREGQPYTFKIEAVRPTSCVFEFSRGRWTAVSPGAMGECAARP